MSDTYRAQVDPDAPNNPHSIALRLVGGGKRVLEVGCSVGHVTEHLVAAGNRVVGVDIDPDAAEQARRFAERVHVADLDVTDLSTIEDDSFDVILLGDVLEHFRDPSAVLADLVTLLEPDGRLVVSVPNVGHVDVRLHLLEGRWEYQRDGLLDRTHQRWFTRAGLRELLDSVGFVAAQLDPVRQGRGASLLPLTTGLHATDVVRFVETDPDAHVYQFVVDARRREFAGDTDALAPISVDWPDLDAEAASRSAHVAALEHERDALLAEVDAFRRSRLVPRHSPAAIRMGICMRTSAGHGVSESIAPRIGVLRPNRPSVAVVARAEARVIRVELERRLGPVTLDLRIAGTALSPWEPIEHAAWPVGVDALLGATELWSEGMPPLTSLFGRTVEPSTAAVRSGMLRHLGLLPSEPFTFDDAHLADLDDARLRPTDLWVIVTAASNVTTSEPDISVLTGVTDVTRLDAVFDRIAVDLAAEPAVATIRTRQLARLVSERDELRRRLAELEAEVARDRERYREVARELAVWRDRCERAELQGGIATDGGTDLSADITIES